MRLKVYIILILSGVPMGMFAQICDGNLGENIFTEGDFGSGFSNVLLPDPQIAPGYAYQPSPPPNDGFYTITNNTTSWGSFAAAAWANITDNSSDPNGYMMVVNASYDPGLFYTQEVEGLCENSLYVFSVDIFNLINQGGNAIKPNVSFLLDGNVIYTTGDVPENEQWNTYGFTFSTEPGQTSITLSLQNNAPGGGGNDLALDNITFRPCGPDALILPTEIANICEDGSPIDLEATILGDQYETPYVQWQQSFDEGMTWTDILGATDALFTHTDLSGGFYYYRYLLANEPGNLLNAKCRVNSNVKIVHVVPKFYTIVDTLCTGLSFSLGTNFYSEQGVYVDSLITYLGCDSIVTLDLTIVPEANIDAVFSLENPSCSYLFDGSISVDTIINGYKPLSIFVNNELQSFPASLFNLGEEEQTYQVIDHFGCSFESILSLELPPPFTIELGDNLQIELGESLQLEPIFSEFPETFIWSPADLVDCDPDCETLEFVPTNSALFLLNAISETGCVASDSIFVEVKKVRNVYIPNAFSPNSDGINDYFTIFGSIPNIQQIEQFQVFNRWGGLVFEQKSFFPNELSMGWNGKVGGEKMPTGVYTYKVKIRFLDGEAIWYAGDVVLIGDVK
ncbi:MAG: gliding motility-associated C-terminal domain-containing protein [Bacteroidetes bacterium]|jgi:gliding motility-associated-like protein|nr:gliding motility-associated C-terminal domain-containing protein [Bacteroidota bacterium]MDF1865200.1 gliding motility-associated C-terminal domain-containing protein [Saprospiraceae bacterium]